LSDVHQLVGGSIGKLISAKKVTDAEFVVEDFSRESSAKIVRIPFRAVS